MHDLWIHQSAIQKSLHLEMCMHENCSKYIDIAFIVNALMSRNGRLYK